MKFHGTEIVGVAAKERNFYQRLDRINGPSVRNFGIERLVGASLNMREFRWLVFPDPGSTVTVSTRLEKLAPNPALRRMTKVSDDISEDTLRELVGAAFEGMSDKDLRQAYESTDGANAVADLLVIAAEARGLDL